MHSVSQKHHIFADQAIHLQQRGINRIDASLLINSFVTVPIKGEWLEAFWCDECQQKNWYYVQQTEAGQYHLSLAPQELWQQATGVINPQGNPSVGQFTRNNARQLSCNILHRFYDS
ncbi:MAG: hypothetical protein NW214_15785 [Pseudanabaenaceae cyanobacterium bins.39]|nr:hypothetical protein [Pseudanabaenaceae cyanobacterium bins.39]